MCIRDRFTIEFSCQSRLPVSLHVGRGTWRASPTATRLSSVSRWWSERRDELTPSQRARAAHSRHRPRHPSRLSTLYTGETYSTSYRWDIGHSHHSGKPGLASFPMTLPLHPSPSHHVLLKFSDWIKDGGKGRGMEGKYIPWGVTDAEILTLDAQPVLETSTETHPFFDHQQTSLFFISALRRQFPKHTLQKYSILSVNFDNFRYTTNWWRWQWGTHTTREGCMYGIVILFQFSFRSVLKKMDLVRNEFGSVRIL